MPNFAWCTDVHLDALQGDNQKLIAFGESLIKENPDGIFITGDISNAREVLFHLSALEKIVSRPLYFVLGNHDYYGGDTAIIRKQMKDLCNTSQYLRYMQTQLYLALSPTTAVVGHDGWYDALYGNVKNTNFLMRDWDAIGDFAREGALVGGGGWHTGTKQPNYNVITTVSRKLAHEGVLHVQQAIKAAVRYHKTIVVLTHFVPFKEAHLHRGVIGDEGSQPWYTSKMMGDMLRQASNAFPNVRFEIFCGHTHGKYDGQVANNMNVHVGHAEYGTPELQSLVMVP
jgi:predicted phosphohydrolase